MTHPKIVPPKLHFLGVHGNQDLASWQKRKYGYLEGKGRSRGRYRNLRLRKKR